MILVTLGSRARCTAEFAMEAARPRLLQARLGWRRKSRFTDLFEGSHTLRISSCTCTFNSMFEFSGRFLNEGDQLQIRKSLQVQDIPHSLTKLQTNCRPTRPPLGPRFYDAWICRFIFNHIKFCLNDINIRDVFREENTGKARKPTQEGDRSGDKKGDKTDERNLEYTCVVSCSQVCLGMCKSTCVAIKGPCHLST